MQAARPSIDMSVVLPNRTAPGSAANQAARASLREGHEDAPTAESRAPTGLEQRGHGSAAVGTAEVTSVAGAAGGKPYELVDMVAASDLDDNYSEEAKVDHSIDQEQKHASTAEAAKLPRKTDPHAALLTFVKMSDAVKEQMIANLKTQRVRKGQTIVKQGGMGDCMYFLNEGTTEIYINGNKLPFQIKAPDFFGERALMYDEQQRSATIKAATDCELLCLGIKPFRKILDNNPDFKTQVRVAEVVHSPYLPIRRSCVVKLAPPRFCPLCFFSFGPALTLRLCFAWARPAD